LGLASQKQVASKGLKGADSGLGVARKAERPSMVLIACFSVNFMSYGIRFVYSMLLPEIMRELNLTNAQIGLIYTSYLTFYTVTSALAGFLVDVRGIRGTMLTFLPLLGVGTALMCTMSSDRSGALFLGLAGVGASVCWTPQPCGFKKPIRREEASLWGFFDRARL